MLNKFRFQRTQFGWQAFCKQGNAYIYFGHFYTQRKAKESWVEKKYLEEMESFNLDTKYCGCGPF